MLSFRPIYMSTRALAIAVALAGFALPALVSAAPAAAGQIVYDQNSQIVAAGDDGSSPHVLVSLAQSGGMQGLADPDVSPNGSTLVFDGTWSQADSEATSWAPVAPGACGLWCSGVYQLAGGTLTRLSNAPASCHAVGFPCATFEANPTIGPGGNVLDSFQLYQDEQNCAGCFWQVAVNYNTLSAPGRSVANAPATGDVANPCSGGDVPSYPDISPDGTSVLYTNCKDTSSGEYETVWSALNGSGQHACAFDDNKIDGPSWSLDGKKLVEAEFTTPGLFVYTLGAGSCTSYYQAVAYSTSAWSGLQSPRFIGGGRIAFVAIAAGAQGGNVYTVPDTCGANGTPCQFPADAHQLTTGGGTFRVTWTAQSVAPAANNLGGSGSTPGGGNNNGGGSGSTGGSTGGGSGSAGGSGSGGGPSGGGSTVNPGSGANTTTTTTTTTTSTTHTPGPALAPKLTLAAPRAPHAGHAVTFHGPRTASDGTRIKRWSWSFGDHSHSASGATVRHTFRHAGHYKVVLTATLANGHKLTAKFAVTVKP